MRRWLVRMGPHRFTVEAPTLTAAHMQMLKRLCDLGLEQGPWEWEELDA